MRRTRLIHLFLVSLPILVAISIPATILGTQHWANACTEMDPNKQLPCLLKRVPVVQKFLGVPKTLAYIEAHIYPDIDLTTTHLVLHGVGQKSYRKHGDIQSSLTYIDPYIQPGTYSWTFDGYRHGVYQEYLRGAQRNGVPTSEAIHTICAQFYDTTIDNLDIDALFELSECFHGVGHAAMFATGNDIDASLAYCDTTPRAVRQNEWCAYGVFMEASYFFWQGWNPNLPTFAKNHPSLRPICSTISEHYQDMCASHVGRSVIYGNFQDFAGALNECDQLAAESQVHSCIGRTARRSVAYMNKESYQDALTQCTTLTGESSYLCVDGVIRGIAFQNSEPPTFIVSGELCEQLPEAYVQRCKDAPAGASHDNLETYNLFLLYQS